MHALLHTDLADSGNFACCSAALRADLTRSKSKPERTPMNTPALPFALATLVVLGGCATHQAQAADLDPTQTDGDKYQVVLENEHVRVLRYHDEPGAKTHLHHHPAFLMVALSSFRRRLVAADGSEKIREFAAGEVAWMPAQSHVGENIGSTPTDGLLIELK
jgi:hypothetical protein